MMKKTLLFCALVFAASGVRAQMDTLSYALGVDVGGNFKRNFPELRVDFSSMKRGVSDGLNSEEASTRAILEEYFERENPAGKKKFRNAAEKRRISHAMGFDVGHYTRSRWSVSLQIDPFMEGLQAAQTGKRLKISPEQAEAYLRNYFTEVVPARNKAENAAWLEEVAAQPGVQKTASGLLYRVVRAGGSAAKDDRDRVRYTGWNHKGEAIDENDSAEFALNRLIKGWTEGLKLVGEGGRITLWIPSELAYGEQGAGGRVAANEALRFEIEVLDLMPYTELKGGDSAWLEEVAAQPGVQKTASGLLYRVVRAGDMTRVATNEVSIHYTGFRRTGEAFTSTVFDDLSEAVPFEKAQDEPVSEAPWHRWFQELDEGMREGLGLVGEGGKITLWIPAELTSGETAVRFDVEVVEVMIGA